MTLQAINYGAAANDGTGDSLREAMRKSQANFEYLDQSKADAQATEQAIAQKADAQATAQAISQKADAQATELALEGKVTAEAGKSLMTDVEREKLEGIASGAQVNVATNLALGAATANAREITSSTGGSVTLPAATSSTAGLMTAAESAKLSTVATNASANSSDAFLLNRGNHSGPLNWAWSTYGGTANAITLTPAFAREAYATGDQFRFRAAVTNTGATTINVGGLGAKTAVTVTGAALPAGYIRTDVDTVCVYDGVRFVVQRELELNSNANGEYVRYADGVQECWGRVILPKNSPAASVTWTFPAIFTSVSVVTQCITGNAEDSGSQEGIGQLYRNGLYQEALSVSSVRFASYEYTIARTQPIYLQVYAKGRWY